MKKISFPFSSVDKKAFERSLLRVLKVKRSPKAIINKTKNVTMAHRSHFNSKKIRKFTFSQTFYDDS